MFVAEGQTPPIITGEWLVTERYTLFQESPEKEATLHDIERLDDINVFISQKEEFVIIKYLNSDLSDIIGIWNPKLVNEKIVGWELLLAFHNINAIGFLQILQTSKCGTPTQLWSNIVDSFTSLTNPLQRQTVSRSIFVKKDSNINIPNSPNISGKWLLTDRKFINDTNINEEATLKDIEQGKDLIVKIKQKNEFITWYGQNDKQNRIGIWQPKFYDGKLNGWQLLLANYKNTSIGFINILEECCKPSKLYVNFVESYLSLTDPNQIQSVEQGVLIKKEQNNCNKFEFPDISGNWFLTNHYSIIVNNTNPTPSLDDITKRADVPIKIKQKGNFITWKFLDPTPQFPHLRNRLGIANPILFGDKITDWEFILADFDDTNIAFIQVLETDKCGRTVKLTLRLVESFFSGLSPVQAQTVSRGVVIRR